MLTDQQQPIVDPYTGMVGVNPATGEPAYGHQYQVESQQNFLRVSGVPVLYWPTFATSLEKPTFYVNNLRVRNDSIFGFQMLTSSTRSNCWAARRRKASTGISISTT